VIIRYHAPVTLERMVAAAAQHTVCQYAVDAAEATELMCMLGIYPGQELDETATTPQTLNR
jgi:hypothetical protein